MTAWQARKVSHTVSIPRCVDLTKAVPTLKASAEREVGGSAVERREDYNNGAAHHNNDNASCMLCCKRYLWESLIRFWIALRERARSYPVTSVIRDYGTAGLQCWGFLACDKDPDAEPIYQSHSQVVEIVTTSERHCQGHRGDHVGTKGVRRAQTYLVPGRTECFFERVTHCWRKSSRTHKCRLSLAR